MINTKMTAEDIIAEAMRRQQAPQDSQRNNLKQAVQQRVDALLEEYRVKQDIAVFFQEYAGLVLAQYKVVFGDLAYGKVFLDLKEIFKTHKANITDFRKSVDKLYKVAKRQIEDQLNEQDFATEDAYDAKTSYTFHTLDEAQETLAALAEEKTVQALVDAKIWAPLPDALSHIGAVVVPAVMNREFVSWKLYQKNGPDPLGANEQFIVVPDVLCSVIIPTRKVLNDKGFLIGFMAAHLTERNTWEESFVDYTPFQNAKTFGTRFDIPQGTRIVQSEPVYKLLIRLITETTETVRQVREAGWNAHVTDFILGNRSILGNEPLILSVEDENNSLVTQYQTQGDEDQWKAAMRRALMRNDGSLRGQLLTDLSAMLAGPVIGVLQDRESIILNHAADPSSGKSTAQKWATTIWGAPTAHITWTSTLVGIERKLASVRHAGVMIDELKLLLRESKGEAIFSRFVYMIVDSEGKNRGAKAGGTQYTPTWGQCVLTSYERPLATESWVAGTGLQTRLIEIYGQTLEPRSDVLIAEINAALQTHYGFAGPEFVRYCANHLEDIKGDVQRRRMQMVQAMVGWNTPQEVTSRQSRSWAIFQVAGQWLANYLEVPEALVEAALLNTMKTSLMKIRDNGVERNILETMGYVFQKANITRPMSVDGSLTDVDMFDDRLFGTHLNRDKNKWIITNKQFIELCGHYAIQYTDAIKDFFKKFPMANETSDRDGNKKPLRAWAIDIETMHRYIANCDDSSDTDETTVELD